MLKWFEMMSLCLERVLSILVLHCYNLEGTLVQGFFVISNIVSIFALSFGGYFLVINSDLDNKKSVR